MNHVRTDFSIEVSAPYATVAPLFGAHEERRWVPGWDPQFVYPRPASDVEGMVFRAGGAVWVNTLLDLDAGRVQYVNVLPDVATRLDIHLQNRGDRTAIRVAYERTALEEGAEGRVAELAAGDRRKAADWKGMLESALEVTSAG